MIQLSRVNLVQHSAGRTDPSLARITVREPATELKVWGEVRVSDAARATGVARGVTVGVTEGVGVGAGPPPFAVHRIVPASPTAIPRNASLAKETSLRLAEVPLPWSVQAILVPPSVVLAIAPLPSKTNPLRRHQYLHQGNGHQWRRFRSYQNKMREGPNWHRHRSWPAPKVGRSNFVRPQTLWLDLAYERLENRRRKTRFG